MNPRDAIDKYSERLIYAKSASEGKRLAIQSKSWLMEQLREWVLGKQKTSAWDGVGTTNFRDVNKEYNQALTDLAEDLK